jgi:hypothetical protein
MNSDRNVKSNPKNSIQEVGVWIYLWDLLDEGIDKTLEYLRSRGFGWLHLAVLYHAGRFLLPHNPLRKVYILEDGTAYFIPRGSYGNLKPARNSMVEDGDPIAEVIRTAHRKDMKVTAWIVLTHNTRLGTANPDSATINAFGDLNPAILCPANSDVQDYCINCCRDLLQHYEFDGLQIETMDYWGWGLEHGFHHEKIGIKLADWAGWLLSLCFCPACLVEARRGGLEIASLRQSVVAALGRHFETGEELAFDLIPPEDLARFQQIRQASVTMAVRRLRDEAFSNRACRLEYIISPERFWQRNAGVDVGQLSSLVDGFVLMAYYPTPEEVTRAVEAFPATVPGSRVLVGLQACFPFLRSRDQIVQTLQACLAHGHQRFSFYNFGLVPYRVMDWIGEALNELEPSGGRNDRTAR